MIFIAILLMLVNSQVESEKLTALSVNAQLLQAIEKDDIKAVMAMIKGGLDVNSPVDKRGRTALMIASRLNSNNVVRGLLSRGSDVEQVDSSGWTALMWAASSKEPYQTITILVEQGASADHRASHGETALIIAAQNKRAFKAIEFLIQNAVDVHQADKDGNTALMHAAFEGISQNVRILLNAGANRQKNKHGYNGWAAAGSSGDIQTMLLLGWKKIIVLYFALVITFTLIGLLAYPLFSTRSATNQKRTAWLKRVFFFQISMDLLFFVIVFIGRVTERYSVPTLIWGYFFAGVGLLGLISSIVAYIVMRESPSKALQV